jgi:phosphoglycerate kinase
MTRHPAGEVVGLANLSDKDLDGARAVVRVDFNVPMDDGRIADDTRIVASLPTLEYLATRGASIVILSHMGRPKGKPDPRYSLRAVAAHLQTLTRHPVGFCATTVGTEASQAVEQLRPGAMLLLENTRFLEGEEQNSDQLARELAALGTIYVNDAFGAAHRAHASTEGIAHYLRPAVAGLLMQKELAFLGGALRAPSRPFVGILGGAKISGKIDVLESLLPMVDRMLIGGAMACTFLRAMGMHTGVSLVEEDRVEMARSLLQRFGDAILLPSDALVATSLHNAAEAQAVTVQSIPPEMAMFDIGPATALAFRSRIVGAGCVLWNGPMGVFETPPFDAGTLAVAQSLASATAAGATTIVGGGDSAAAVAELGLADKISHISTGGGASLEFLEGKVLPGLAALDMK